MGPSESRHEPPATGGRATARRTRDKGLTIVEMIAAVAVLAILATLALPLARNAIQRRKETELKRALFVMRSAIDRYHDLALRGAIPPWDPDWEYFPPDLETLAEGVEMTNSQTGRKRVEQFLREIPQDPMTGERSWGLRSYQMEPDDRSWDGQNVYDVWSLATGTALDGSEYRDW